MDQQQQKGAPPLPPVEKLRPGVWSIPVPLPMTSLGHVFVYLFEADDGAYVVDAGWNTDEAFGAVEAGLALAGYEITDLRGVMVTHVHPDHYGLAGRLREASGAWISLHPADAGLIQNRYIDPSELLTRMNAMMRRAGAPADVIESLTRAAMPVLRFVDPVLPDILLEDGDRPEVKGWDLKAIWTPGHSPGHLCFWEPVNEVLLSGDHVLPRITPNIPFHPQAGDNPLGDFFASLDKVDQYPAREVLPAHEHRFVDLHGRVEQLKAHHEHRFAEIGTALRSGVTTSWGVAERMAWSRSWDSIEGFMKRAALAEALAHLRALERRGVVREVDGEPSTWELLED